MKKSIILVVFLCSSMVLYSMEEQHLASQVMKNDIPDSENKEEKQEKIAEGKSPISIEKPTNLNKYFKNYCNLSVTPTVEAREALKQLVIKFWFGSYIISQKEKKQETSTISEGETLIEFLNKNNIVAEIKDANFFRNFKLRTVMNRIICYNEQEITSPSESPTQQAPTTSYPSNNSFIQSYRDVFLGSGATLALVGTFYCMPRLINWYRGQ